MWVKSLLSVFFFFFFVIHVQPNVLVWLKSNHTTAKTTKENRIDVGFFGIRNESFGIGREKESLCLDQKKILAKKVRRHLKLEMLLLVFQKKTGHKTTKLKQNNFRQTKNASGTVQTWMDHGV